MQHRQNNEWVFRSLCLLKREGEELLAPWTVSIAAFFPFPPLPSAVLLSLLLVHTLILIQWQSKPNLSLAKIATKLKFVDFIFILRLYFQI